MRDFPSSAVVAGREGGPASHLKGDLHRSGRLSEGTAEGKAERGEGRGASLLPKGGRTKSGRESAGT